MESNLIQKEEFIQRVDNIKKIMDREGLDVVVIFGDEYRREYVRYTSDFWPIFERSSVFIFRDKDPVLGVSAECENYARESSVWRDISNIEGFGCVTVPEKIDFPFAKIYTFKEIFDESIPNIKDGKIGIVGLDSIPVPLFKLFKESLMGFKVEDITSSFNKLRLIKSKNEIACLKKAAEIADMAYKEMMAICKPGITELEVAASGEYIARKNGAEFIPFCNVMSGERTNTVIGRATEKKIKEGEIMSIAIAVQYNGYISSVQFPFTVGGKFSKDQKELVDSLVEVESIALKHLRNGVKANKFVKEVRDYFRKKDLSKYDIYPPLHGVGIAEAESPYPDEQSDYEFETGMTVNVDISLFNTNAFSNRIEEGFVITDNGYEPMSKLVRNLTLNF